MNDPHVEALIYVIDHDSTVSYENATPIEFEHPEFRVRVEDGHARFEFKEHYATVEEARSEVQPFIDQWEFEESLRVGPGQFALRFDRPVIVDRQPTTGVHSVSAGSARYGFTISTPSVTVSRPYPPPPSAAGMDIHDADVGTMCYRYLLYREGADRLPSMAYFCCEVFTKRLSNGTKDAADKHKISHNLIGMVHKLSSTKGGAQGRHASAIEHPLTQCETRFLEKAVVAMIIRAAKVAADPNQSMEVINVGNLMEISP